MEISFYMILNIFGLLRDFWINDPASPTRSRSSILDKTRKRNPKYLYLSARLGRIYYPSPYSYTNLELQEDNLHREQEWEAD
mmetsp:Transcript_1574/g.1798  ORF Transcript_1574/g.1798 Transcript_1574/m.1798 type:complete len:82 (-) Transcript_1574:633-878(-)